MNNAGRHCGRVMRPRALQRGFLLLIAAAVLGSSLTPVLAEPRRDARYYRHPPIRHRYYGPPPVVYAPPPVAYGPPPVVYQPAPSLNVVIPLRF